MDTTNRHLQMMARMGRGCRRRGTTGTIHPIVCRVPAGDPQKKSDHLVE
jgi:hypothetical protein